MAGTNKTLISVAVAYTFMVVVCFGPATVESEKAEAAYQSKCPTYCLGGPRGSDGLYKAMFWPFWISYELATLREGK